MQYLINVHLTRIIIYSTGVWILLIVFTLFAPAIHTCATFVLHVRQSVAASVCEERLSDVDVHFTVIYLLQSLSEIHHICCCFFICEVSLNWAAGWEQSDSGREAARTDRGFPPHTLSQRSTGTSGPPPWPRTSSLQSPANNSTQTKWTENLNIGHCNASM